MARASACASTDSSVKCRTVRRAATASRAPSRRASAVPSGNRSSSRGRTPDTAPGPSSTVTRSPSPRTMATGTPPDLPLTRSAADAISSATAMTVASIARPWASGRPRRSSSTVTPATPMAQSVSPSRQGRPSVSVTMTPTETPVISCSRCRSARADASGSRGRSSTCPAGALLASIPAAARTSPWCVRTIRVMPLGVSLVATTVTVSASSASSRSDSGTTRPSDLLTILLVTTTMSPARSPVVPSGHSVAAIASARVAARSLPAVISPIPVTPTTCRLMPVVAGSRRAPAQRARCRPWRRDRS